MATEVVFDVKVALPSRVVAIGLMRWIGDWMSFVPGARVVASGIHAGTAESVATEPKLAKEIEHD